MRKIRASVMLGVALGAAASVPAAPTIRVTDRSLATIYVDAGRDLGLQAGDRLRVVRRGTTVAEMTVLSVNEHAAACRVLSLTRPITRGDRVVPLDAASRAAAGGPSAFGRPESPAKAAPHPHPDPAASNGPAGGIAPAGTKGLSSAPRGMSGSPPERSAPVTGPPVAIPDGDAAETAQSGEPIRPDGSGAPTEEEPEATLASSGGPGTEASSADASPTRVESSASETAPGPTPLSDRTFTIKYRSATSAYLDSGRAGGLEVGDRLRVLAGTTTVAVLEVAYIAELSASCEVLSETRSVQAGDVAHLVSAAARTAEAEEVEVEASTPETSISTPVAAEPVPPAPRLSRTPSRLAWGRLRGAASFGYLRSWDHTASALDFQQRTARLDLRVDDIAGQPLSFRIRARSRQDIRARALSLRTPRDERSDRLYEAALRYEPLGEPVAVELGRIGMYRFVGVGYLDGAFVRLHPRPGLEVGGFGGRRMEIAGPRSDGNGNSYGAFIRLVPAGPSLRSGYDILLTYARDNAEGDISREYLSLESSFGNGSRWSLFQRAELDLNRGWRHEVAGKSYQISNLSFSGNLRLTRSAWAFLSYDGRRNYRYFRNRLVPEEVFDDLLHQGLRAGVNIARPSGFGATAGFGMSLKEPDPRHPELNIANAYSFNAGVRHADLFSIGLSAGLDGSAFTNGYADGGLLSTHLGWYLPGGHMLDLSYGYSLYRVLLTEERRTTQWLRFLGRAQLSRWLYVLGDLEYDAGDDLGGPRVFLELGVLF